MSAEFPLLNHEKVTSFSIETINGNIEKYQEIADELELQANVEFASLQAEYQNKPSGQKITLDYELRWKEYTRLCWGLSRLRFVIAYSQTASFSILNVARSDGQIIGFDIILRAADGSHRENFFAVNVDYRGLGIGSSLVQLRHHQLLNLGITSYIADLWEKSLHVFQRLGCELVPISIGENKYRVILVPEDLNNYSPSDPSLHLRS